MEPAGSFVPPSFKLPTILKLIAPLHFQHQDADGTFDFKTGKESSGGVEAKVNMLQAFCWL